MLIRRDQMRESFWLEMEHPTQETRDLTFELFDRYGRFNREYYEHEFRKGTGVWGNELDYGDLLLFEELEVDPEYRRLGLGTGIVKAILERTRKKVDESEGFFALVRPGFLLSELPRGERENPERSRSSRKRLSDVSRGFWHSLGFRRVGTSTWFVRTDSPNHPSRHLEVSQDWQNPDEAEGVPLSDDLKHLFGRLADPTVEEIECIDDIRKALPEDSGDQQWVIVDQAGNTLLHIAAMAYKPELVKFTYSKATRLATIRNKEAYAPLEALRNRLEHQRSRSSTGHRSWVKSDGFTGFRPPSIACLAALDNTTAVDLSALSHQDIEAVSSATNEQVRIAPQLDIGRNTKDLAAQVWMHVWEMYRRLSKPENE